MIYRHRLDFSKAGLYRFLRMNSAVCISGAVNGNCAVPALVLNGPD
jgi:hypothetical protein